MRRNDFSDGITIGMWIAGFIALIIIGLWGLFWYDDGLKKVKYVEIGEVSISTEDIEEYNKNDKSVTIVTKDGKSYSGEAITFHFDEKE